MESDIENVKIKSIYLPLRDYEFDHGPSTKNLANDKFIGRKNIIDRLCLLLNVEGKRNQTGVYLVAGYRGMGKTSVVREAITKINNPQGDSSENIPAKQTKLKSFEFSLSQDEVHEFELLRQIAWKLDRYFKDDLDFDSKLKKVGLYRYLCSLGLLLLSLFCVLWIFNSAGCKLLTNPFHENSIGFAFLFFGLIALIYTALRKLCSIIPILSSKKAEITIIQKICTLNDDLQNRIYSSLSQEDSILTSINLGNTNPATSIANKILNTIREEGDNKRNTVFYKKAAPKEIEQYLHQILKSINKLRGIRGRRGTRGIKCIKCIRKKPENKEEIPPFVFVIDELDKIEPDYYFTPGDNESEKFLYQSTTSFHVDTKARKRSEAITRLLANLKNFLNSSSAKFIFIGGRGMYDASLADIADRESFYSSIFNEVIYIPNFFKDKLSPYSGITQLTESFLCSLLMKKDEEKEKEKWRYNLMNLIQEYKEAYSTVLNNEKKTFKVLHTLQNLIIYLTLRSNGSPKKLIELMEGFVYKVENEDLVANELFIKNTICSKNTQPQHEQLYLRVSYQNQYEINLHSDLYRPYISINSKYLKSLGDKLLYSTAYLIDHILKFHKTAFSWRNLEHMPDIILANKDPYFRQFYSDIMSNLSHQHLRTTVNGIFQYKFNKKVANELKFVSKISEQSSAAFNFTLDESYHLKSYYKKKLAAKYKEYKELSLNKGKFQYIYPIGYLHSVIAEIHYYDAEFDDAILHYSDALQLLRSDDLESASNPHHYVLFVRNALNMGLCFEKLKMYDRAYSMYRSMILKLTRFGNATQKQYITNTNDQRWESPYKRILLFQRPHIALLSVIEKDRQDGITYDNLQRNLVEYLQFLGISSRQLFPLKDKGKDSHLKKHIEYEKLEFTTKGINVSVDKKRIVTLISDYYFSIASMLFYKNNIFSMLSFQSNITCNVNSQIIENLKNKTSSFYHPSHSAYLYYLFALINFNAPYIENIRAELGRNKQLFNIQKSEYALTAHMKFVTNYLDLAIYKILNSDQFNFLGNILTKLGDAVLSCLSKKDKKLSRKYILLFDSGCLDVNRRKLIIDQEDALSLDLVLVLYRISYHCYIQAGKKHYAAFQYKKMLYVLKDTIFKNSTNPVVTEGELDKIFNIPIKIQIDTSGVSVHNQLIKYEKYTKDESAFTTLLYNNLSTSPEIKEYILLRESILIKLGLKKKSSFYIGEYSTISSMFTRILELKFKGDQELAELKERKKKPCSNSVNSKNIETVINAVFSFSQILKILKTYGVGYILNHSFLAAIYERMAAACIHYREYSKPDSPTILEERLKKLIGNNIIFSLDPYEYYDLARIHYQLAIELHSEGNAYKEASKEMYVLDDDFNDNLTHFCAAIERYQINTGHVDTRLNILKKQADASGLADIRNYIE